MVNPKQVLQSLEADDVAASGTVEILLTSDAVFEPMQGIHCGCASNWRLTVGLNLNDKKAVVAEIPAEVANAQTIVAG